MKPLFVIALLLCSCCRPAAAQEKLSPASFGKAHQNNLRHLLALQRGSTRDMRVTAGAARRVVAQGTRNVSGQSDSFRVKYSGTRGSSYDYSLMLYNYNYPYANTPVFDFAGHTTTPQILYDTMSHWTLNPIKIGVFERYEMGYARYDLHDNLTNFDLIYTDTANQDMRYANTFTSAGKISEGYWLNLGLTADSSHRQLFQYDVSGKIISDSVYKHVAGGGWHLVSAGRYIYNLSGNLTELNYYQELGSKMTHMIRYQNEYDAFDRLSVVQVHLFDGDTLSPALIDSFGYALPAIGFHTWWKEYQYDHINDTLLPYYSMTKHLNSLDKPDTVYIHGWSLSDSSWHLQQRYDVYYNTYEDPDTLKCYEYSIPPAPMPSLSSTTVYYYEDRPTVTVVHLDAGPSLTLYPNPADYVVCISGKDVAAGTPVVAEVMTMDGRRALSLRKTWDDTGIRLPVADLPPGQYYVLLRDEQQRVLYGSIFMRR